MIQKEILFITGNQSKLEEVINIAEKYSVKIIGKKMDLPEIMTMKEEKILIEKTKYAFEKLKKPLIIDDSGIYFKAYPNFPGVFSKFIIKLIGFDGIFKLLKNKSRKAYFKCAIAFMDKDLNKPLLFKGKCDGEITERISKVFDPNFEFNSIFISKGEDETFSEITIEKREKISHRAQALEKFLHWLVTKTK